MSSLLGLCETIGAHGLFGALYTDRGSHYFLTPKAGGKVAKTQPTQVGQALARLGIRHIPSYSPEGRGRMERVFGTLQQRLPPELRRAGVSTMAAANGYMREVFVPDYNAPLRQAGGGARNGIRRLCRPAAGRRAVRAGGAPGRSRQLRAMGQVRAADPAAAASPSLRQGDGAGAPISGRQTGDLRWAALPGPLRSGRHAAGRACCSEGCLNRSAGPPVDLWTTPGRCPQPHRRHFGRSGHMIRYISRTSLRVTDRLPDAGRCPERVCIPSTDLPPPKRYT